MKYNIKRLNTLHNKEMLSFKKIKNKYNKKKTYVSDNNIWRAEEQDNATNWDSITKTSNSPKKNERYSKIVAQDDDFDDTGDAHFQKALSMPLNFTRVNEPKSASPEAQGIDILLSDLQIDEIEEDMKSVEEEDDSDADSSSFSKKQSDWKSKKNISEKSKPTSKINKKKFFIHKAQSLKKTRESGSRSPIKGVISNIQNTKRKIKFMKMNSVAFKTTDWKMSERWSIVGQEQSVSSCEEDGGDTSPHNGIFKFGSSKDVSRTIISPIRCDGPGKEQGKKFDGD